ncbi:MAG: NADPH-dependent glutamate synthase [Acidobacteria bacterium]|nr:MAG: NADPH-dependent glutamate synthase [Acidobacteriota bacterium]
MAEFLPPKERRLIPRQEMPEQDPRERIRNFAEVNLGLTPELAIREAQRCLGCKNPKCVEGCPVGIRIRDFIFAIVEEKFDEAARIIKQDNSLPAICGRVCPQEEQCEKLCIVGKRDRPVAIGWLERFVADHERERGIPDPEPPARRSGRRVAVVGSGPAGLSCATDLARMGHEVVVFEALHELGGVLVYGIPEFRLPKEIVRAEIDQLRKMGVRFETNTVIGLTATVDELLGSEGFDAVFLGVGAGLPRFLGVPGENLIGIYSANEFLTRVNLMQAWREDADTPVLDVAGRDVAVFGGGNTAMDAVRTSLRLGARSAKIIYRRSEAEMPARNEEIAHAREEGVEFVLLTNPLRFDGDENGRVRSVTLQRMELGEPDDSGRRRPVPVPGSEYVEPIDLAVVAIGNSPNPLIGRTTGDIAHTRWGTIVADEKTGRTTRRGVFAGGDIVTGGATVILAMGAGRRAARAIDEFLTTGVWDDPQVAHGTG